MKQLLILILILISSWNTIAQTTVAANRIDAKRELIISSKGIDSLIIRNTLTYATHRKLASAQAIKEYIDNKTLNVDTFMNDVDVASATVSNFIQNRKVAAIFLDLSSGASSHKFLALPNVSGLSGREGTQLIIGVRDQSSTYDYYILPNQSSPPELMLNNDYYANRYYFDNEEVATFTLVRNATGLIWKLTGSSTSLQSNELNYATDFSNKRVFRNKIVTTKKNGDYLIQNVPISTYNSNAADGTYVYSALDKAPYSKNYIKDSDNMQQGGGNWIYPGVDIRYINDFTVGPNGNKTAERFIRDSGTDNQIWTSPFTTSVGQQWTISFWAKQGVAASNDDLRIRLTLPIDNLAETEINPTTTWERYTVTKTVVDAFATEYYQFTITGTNFDSVDITDVQVEIGAIASDYKRTESTTSVEGVVYGVYKPKGERIEIDEVHQGSMGDSDFIEKSFAFAVTQKEKTLQARKDRLIDEPIDIPEGAHIVGTYNGGALDNNYAAQGTVFRIDLRNAAQSAFTFVGNGGYNEGHTIEGIMLHPISACHSVIKTGQSFGGSIKNVSIVNFGGSTRYPFNGLEVGAGSLAVNVYNCQFRHCRYGINHKGSVTTKVYGGRALDNSMAVKVSGSFYAENFWMEANDSSAVWQQSGALDLVRCYTESTPSVGGSNSPTFKITNAEIVNINNCRFGSHVGLDPTHVMITLDAVKEANFNNSQFIHSNRVISSTVNTGKINAIGNGCDGVFIGDDFVGIYDSLKVIALGNSGILTDQQHRDWLPDTYLFNPDIESGEADTLSLHNPIVSGNLNINSPTINNVNNNIVIQSENILMGSFGWSGGVVATPNDTINFDASMTAERLTYGANGLLRFTPTITLVTGRWYVVSFYIANSNMTTINVDLGDVLPAKVITVTNTDDWIRHSVLIQHTNATNFVDIEFVGTAGKYAHVSGVSVSDGRYLAPYLKTTGTPLTADLVDPMLHIRNGEDLTFKGNVDIDGTLEAKGAVIYSYEITPTALAAQTDNWSPTGIGSATTIRVSLTGNQSLTGLNAPNVGGRRVKIDNIDATDVLTIEHEHGSSTTTNRFDCTSGQDILVKEGGSIELEYDDLLTRWKPIGLVSTSTLEESIEYSYSSPSGSNGINYIAGYYNAPATDANLTDASPTITLGTANVSYAAYAFAVTAAAGTTNGSTLVLTITGTSITDSGTRTPADSEILIANATTSSINIYYESTKKWIGVITYTLTSNGSTFALDFNYGFAKYEDHNGKLFSLKAFNVSGLCAASDAGFNVQLLKHGNSGWTYSAAAFVPGSAAVASMLTNHSTEREISAGLPFGYQITNLATTIDGTGIEGYIIKVTTTVNGSVNHLNAVITSQREQK